MLKTQINGDSSPQNSPYSSLHNLDSPNYHLKINQQAFDFAPQKVIIDDLKMPLVFLPKSNNNDLWNNIASDILRSIHSEYSFAKKSDFGFKKKEEKASLKKKSEKYITEVTEISSPTYVKDKHFNEKMNSFTNSFKTHSYAEMSQHFGKIDKVRNFTSKDNKRKFAKIHAIILNTKQKTNEWCNKSWEQFHNDIITDFYEHSIEDDLKINDNNMESLRRKSCECDDCGHTTKFQKKANLLMLNFQTRYYQKKMEMQRLLDIAEKERAKNATVLRQARKPKTTMKKENPTLILLKNQTKSSSNQIKNLINSSLKSSAFRRSVGIGPFDDRSMEQIETPPLIPTKKKTVVGFEDATYNEEINVIAFGRSETIAEKKNSEEEIFQNITDRNEKDNNIDLFDKPELKKQDSEDYLTNLLPVRRVTCDLPKKKRDEEEEKPRLGLLKRSQTYFKEKDKSTTSQSKANTEPPQIDLQKNIELVYNQFSPTKNHGKNILNSPSERSRGTNSIKRKYFNSESQSIYEQIEFKKDQDVKEENKPQLINLQKLEEPKLTQDDFNQMLKLNTPKYILFKTNRTDKLIGERNNKKDPLSKIYHSKMLMKILTEQKKQKIGSSKSNNTSGLSFNRYNLNKLENQRNDDDNKFVHFSNFSKFKIRKVSNLTDKQAPNSHRKNKSNIRP